MVPEADLDRFVRRRGWQPGMDVVHTDHGRGWVWGSGVGRVTVRFETAETGPGPVRTFRADDPALSALPLAQDEGQPLGTDAEPDLVARAQLRAVVEVRRLDDADDRVATGGGVVPEEDQRLSVGRHLDRPQHEPLAGQLLLADPGQARPREPQGDPVGVGLDPPGAPDQRVESPPVRTSRSGARAARPAGRRSRTATESPPRPTGRRAAGPPAEGRRRRPARGRSRTGCRRIGTPAPGAPRPRRPPPRSSAPRWSRGRA